ncbi:MAG: arsenate reductase/protein-tyrosine-phosphatase family protein [Syntrophales bacterium]
MNILFVCNANIVRSFMAERILKSLLKSHGSRDVEVSSAGLLDMSGAPADAIARQILQENGVDDEGHHSRLVNEEMIREADLIVTMEKKQLQRIGDLYPEVMIKLRVLKSYLPDKGSMETAEDIRDPYRGSIFYYRLCFAEISLAMGEMIKCI